MRIILLAGAVLALGACSGGNQANNSAADTMSDTGNSGMIVDPAGPGNMGDAAMSGGNMTDQNGSVSAATGNGAADAHTKALMKKDAKTHDHDTNLANGI
ncbi:MAG TPA: hypothetical protein VGC56_17615 [Allosphingosinicella sp.]|jgi:hypothetical protein